jgi:hypothetical protein
MSWRNALRLQKQHEGLQCWTQASLLPLTAETITKKLIAPGDFIIPCKSFKTTNTDQDIFTKGKVYRVLEYSNFTTGLLVQSEAGPWTVTCKEDSGIGKYFSWKRPTSEEQESAVLEQNPFITDIVRAVAQPGSYPQTVEQLTAQVQQQYLSEGGTISPKDFNAQIAAAWGKAFHLGFVAMIRNSDKVAITPKGRQYLAS